MLVLDTNHIRELVVESALGKTLSVRLASSGMAFALAVPTVEEVIRGRMAKLASARNPEELIFAYRKFDAAFDFLAGYIRLPWDAEATARFQHFRAQGIRIGTLDLRIACITLEHDAMLLTRNTVDFAKVPGLRFENWLD